MIMIRYRARSLEYSFSRCHISSKVKVLSPLPFHQRFYSNERDTVELDYTAYIPSSGNETDSPLVILHGLFGSKRNFASLCKAFLRDMKRPIYALDLRNHGSSPHAKPMNYKSMAEDVGQFIQAKRLTDVSLLGHSMGGKVAMALALSSSATFSNLIIADIAPTRTCLSPSFVRYLKVMTTIENPTTGVKTREEAGRILAGIETDLGIRQFLLTNLVLPSASEPSRKTVRFQIPIPILTEAVPALGSFPYTIEEERTWHGRTLVVKGARSDYINDLNIPTLQAFFPEMKLEILDAGHWIHAEQPNEFRKVVVDFILEDSDLAQSPS